MDTSIDEEIEGKLLKLKKNDVLFKQGSFGRYFYIVKSGLIELQFDGQTRRLMKAKEFFGEIGPLAHLPRTATATALAPSEVLELSEEKLREIIEKNFHCQKRLSRPLTFDCFSTLQEILKRFSF